MDEIVVKVFMISNFREAMFSERKEPVVKSNDTVMRNVGKGPKRL